MIVMVFYREMENKNYITYKKPNVQTGQTDLE